MNVTCCGEVFTFPLDVCPELFLELHEISGEDIKINLPYLWVETLHSVLVLQRRPRMTDLEIFDYFCIDKEKIPRLELALRDCYNDFCYIVGEHTDIIPKIKYSLNGDFKELKQLFPEKYEIVEFVLQYHKYFMVFEEPVVFPSLNSIGWKFYVRRGRFDTPAHFLGLPLDSYSDSETD